MVVGWFGWARSHFFRVCWNRSALPQVVGCPGREFFWTMWRRVSSASKGVLASLAAVAGESDRVDHAVVCEGGGGDSVLGKGFAECLEHDRGGDPGADVQGVAGAVVEPGDDLHIGAGSAVGVGEAVVGEVGLPGLVGHGGFETDVGRLRSFLGLGGDQPGASQVAADGRSRHPVPVGMLEMPGDGLGAVVQSRVRESSLRTRTMRSTTSGATAAGEVLGRRKRGSRAASPSAS